MEKPSDKIEIVSVHLPKTSGHAFAEALLQVYNIKEIFFDYPYQAEANLVRIENQIRVIQGHFPATKYRNLFPNAKIITWLRNPIERLISHYFFWKSIPLEEKNTSQRLLQENDLDLVQFSELPEMQNYITSFFIGEMKITDFYFVGIQSFFKEDLKELSVELGWPELKAIAKINPNTYPGYKERSQELLKNSRVIARLEYLNRQDMELYEQALKYRQKRRIQYFINKRNAKNK